MYVGIKTKRFKILQNTFLQDTNYVLTLIVHVSLAHVSVMFAIETDDIDIWEEIFGVFLARICPYFDWIWRDTKYLSLFSRNARKYWPEKVRIGTLFKQWNFYRSPYLLLKRYLKLKRGQFEYIQAADWSFVNDFCRI